VGNNFDVLTPDFVFYVNVNLGDIIKHAISLYVVLKIFVSEYKNGYLQLRKCE
jgi:hypothetical protein